MNYEIKEILDNFINYENKNINKTDVKNFSPDKIKDILKYLKINYKNIKFIHIAGTKGKGSTSYYLSKLINLSTNKKVGLFTSPHIFKINERIKINFNDITDIELYNILEKYKDIFINYKLTYFDVLTVISIIYFCENNCDYVVLETGLGGRLDSTNFCLPIISLITHISYDHTKILGNTLQKIAYEKAGIIKENIPVIVAKQNKRVYDVIEEKAKKTNSKMYKLTDYCQYKILERSINGSISNIQINTIKIKEFRLKQLGDHFLENFLLAALSSDIIGLKLNEEILREAGKLEIPYRIKIKNNNILDVSHNDKSLKYLFDTIINYLPKNYSLNLYLSILKDKEIKRIASIINSYIYLFNNIYFFDFENKRTSAGYELYDKLKCFQNVHYIDNIQNIKLDKSDNIINVITGSFYLISYINNLIE